jgi:MFS transporter, DHA2 family, multidrug resistance protein
MAATATKPGGQTAGQAMWKPKHNPWAIALTVTLATFMEVLDTSIANVSLPHIAGSLAASQSEATWVISSYLVANAVILPISGYLATLIGRKRFYMTCVAMFGISSLLCGLAPSLGMLLFFRVLQGLGGGGLATSEQAILADTFEPKKRGQAFALYGLAVVTAPAIGPLVGGWITDNYEWRWIFFINVPVALISMYLTNRVVEDPPHLIEAVKKARAGLIKIDYTGFVFTALGFGCLEVVLDKGQEDDWFGSHFITTFTIICIASIAALIVWELWQIRKGHKPIIELRLFRSRTFALSFVMMFILGIALYGTTILIPQMLQTLMGYTATNAGKTLSLGGIATLICMPIVGILIAKVDARYLLAFGFAITSVALFHMTTIHLSMSLSYTAWLRFFQATGLGFMFIPIQTLSYVGVPMEANNDVSGLTNLARNMGGSVGTALVATLLARQAQRHQSYLGAHMTGSSASYLRDMAQMSHHLVTGGLSASGANSAAMLRLYQQLQQQAAMLSYIDIIRFFAFAALCMVPLPFVMRKSHGGAAMH